VSKDVPKGQAQRKNVVVGAVTGVQRCMQILCKGYIISVMEIQNK
jgi:hypothetical protein